MKKLTATLVSIGLLLLGCVFLLVACYSGLEAIWFVLSNWGSSEFPTRLVFQLCFFGFVGWLIGLMGRLIYEKKKVVNE